ncbi:hypothetical protein AN396_00285 [Candidatus Epulonipiscium fishelsonii]|uniref:Uncharacterized protein n=1 Tax=Candidatus Epulonipiscium fishelsonii TaxID=77094 RepID=A0ACC8XH60_9FIRM|nr:hypothetical protein AN396_00285 [Epulopiscium sp. SCG-B11WGA-EpuloA1]
MYKIETHCHNIYSSICGHLNAKQILDLYEKEGYDAICITDHYNMETYEMNDVENAEDKEKAMFKGYFEIKELSKNYNIEVIQGAEVRFKENRNDYLIYGITPNIFANPKEIFEMGIVNFSNYAKQHNLIIIQAHPFRHHKQCIPVSSEFVNGYEGYNHHPRHEDFNEKAFALSTKYNLITTSGSDLHRDIDVESMGGIKSYDLPKDSVDMAEILLARNFILYHKN